MSFDEPTKVGSSITLREALAKTYLVKHHGKHGGVIYLPKCLIGKRLNLEEADEGTKTD